MTDPLPGWLSDLRDREEIRELILRYIRGIDRLDESLIRRTFHPGAVDDHGPRKSDVDGLVRWLQDHADGPEQILHLVGNCTIDLFGDRAVAETYSVAYHRFSPTAERAHFGPLEHRRGVPTRMTTVYRYVDRLERRDGRWGVVHRTMVMEDAWLVESALPPPSEQDWTTPRRDRRDAVYEALEWAAAGSAQG